MAIRAASICRLVTQDGSSACRPYSPKATVVPPLASPRRGGRCCLRCFKRFGVSICSAPLAGLGAGVALGPARGRLGGAGAGPRGPRPALALATAALGAVAAATAAAATPRAVAVAAGRGAGTRARPVGLLLL